MSRGKIEPNDSDGRSPVSDSDARNPLLNSNGASRPPHVVVEEQEMAQPEKFQKPEEPEIKVVSQAPDGGYGWVIVIASFFCSLVVDGVSYSLSVYQTEWTDYFKESKSKVALVGSLLNAFYQCMGPIATALANAFGFRKVIFAGAIITAISFVVSSFATSINFLIVSFGICGGIGLGLIYSPSILCVCYYFDKRRAMAVGICVTGSGVSALIGAPIVSIIVENFGWDGSMYFLASAVLQACIAGALMRTLEVRIVEEVEILPKSSSPEETTAFIGGGLETERTRSVSGRSGSTDFRDLKHLPRGGDRKRHMSASTEPGERELVSSRKYYSTYGLDVQTMENGQVRHEFAPALYTHNVSTPDISDDPTQIRRKSIKEFSHPLDRKDIHVQGSLKHIPQGSRADAEAETFLRQSQQSLYRRKAAETATVDGTKPSPKKSWMPDALRVALLEMIDLSIYKNWVFLIFSLASFLGMVAFFVPFLFIPDFAMENYMAERISKLDSSYLISAIGGGNIVGRIFWGWLTDRSGMDPLIIHNACVVVVGVIMGIFPFCGTYTILMGTCAIFGFFLAPFVSLLSIILTSRIGLKQLPSAFGQSQFVRGVATSVGAPIGAALYDIRKNYTLTMLVGGAEWLLAAALASVILVVEVSRKRKKAVTRLSGSDVLA